MVAVDTDPVEIAVGELAGDVPGPGTVKLDLGVGGEPLGHGLHDPVHIGLAPGDGAAVPALGEMRREGPGIDQMQLLRPAPVDDPLGEVTLPDADLGADPALP